MATVTKPHGDFVNNVDVANATYVDDQFNTLYNLVNGNLDSTNVKSAAAIANVTNPWGDNTFPNRSAIEYQANAAQGIAAATWTKVIYAASSIDNLSEWSTANNRFTAKTATGLAAGLYDLQGTISISTGASASNLITIGVYKNGTLIHTVRQDYGTALASPILNFSDKVYLAPGDYVEVYINASLAITLASGSYIRVIKEA